MAPQVESGDTAGLQDTLQALQQQQDTLERLMEEAGLQIRVRVTGHWRN
jgi:hypothetical protein